MEKINLWEYVQKQFHSERKEESLAHQCPLAILLEKRRIEEKDFLESKPFPKKIAECSDLWPEIWPWK